VESKRRGRLTLFLTLVAMFAGLFAAFSLRRARDAERERAKLALRHARLRALFEDNADAIFAVDGDGAIADVNPAAVELTGRARRELEGLHFERLVDGDAAPAIRGALARALDGECATLDLPLVHATGEAFIAAAQVLPAGSERPAAAVHVVARDVTLERIAQAQYDELAARVDRLPEITAAGQRTTAEQIEAALAAAAAELGRECGFIGAFDGNGLRVVARSGERALSLGFHLPCPPELLGVLAADTNPNAAGALENVLGAKIAAGFDAAWRETLAAPLLVDGALFGTLVFGAFARTGRPVTRYDRSYLRLLAAMIATALERERRADRHDAPPAFGSGAILDAR
jgi:PAS domain S-box-containing protein